MVIAMILHSFIAAAGAAEPAPVPLWPDAAPGAIGTEPQDVPSLYHYPASTANATGAAIVVCPGGGYAGLAISYEGHEVAQWLNAAGISAYVLQYRLAPRYRHPAPLMDVQRAIQTVRANALEWNVDPNRIGVLGFSAGGHLASMSGVHPLAGDAGADDTIARVSSNPNFMILVYPVITMQGPYAHAGCARNLLGENPASELLDTCSTERYVTASTPPAFILHTSADEVVPVQNALLFYEACVKANVPAELHCFEQGKHGVGLGGTRAPGNPVGEWPGLCLKWLAVRGIIPSAR